MAATYPTGVKTWVSLIDGTDYPKAADINTLYEEVTAIETELGTSPSGSSSTVKARFDNFDTILALYIAGPDEVPVIGDAVAVANTKLWSSDKINGYITDRIDVNTTNDNLWAGDGAGAGLAAGTDNTLLGNNAGNAVSSGTDNTLIGSEAGLVLTGSDFNTMVGSEAGKANTTAASNVLIGYQAGLAIITGGENVVIGAQAADTMTAGVQNVIIGRSAADKASTSFNHNVVIGYQAAFSDTFGDDSVFIGHQAGYTNAGESSNVFIGYQAGYLNNDSSNVFIGYQAGYNETGQGRLYIMNGNEDETDALIYGEFQNALLRFNGEVWLKELSSNPTPDEGYGIVWMDNGGGSGADGDLMYTAQAGGVTKTYIIQVF
jgi:hypothetical protein